VQLDFCLHRIKDPADFAAKVAWLQSHADATRIDTVELIDGSALIYRTAPLRTSDGRHYGRIWMFREA
jgi:hypothetical protein